jgi:hypothetical protein
MTRHYYHLQDAQLHQKDESRAIGVRFTYVSNQANGIVSYVGGPPFAETLTYNPSFTAGNQSIVFASFSGKNVAQYFNVRTVDVPPPSFPVQPFSIDKGDKIGLTITTDQSGKIVVTAILETWGNATFTFIGECINEDIIFASNGITTILISFRDLGYIQKI